MNLTKALLLAIALLTGPALLSSAAASTAAAAPIKPTDFHQRAHWLFLPKKASRKVDVFYVYPSEYVRSSPSEPIIAPIDDPGMIKGAKVQFQQQATAFRGVGNVYAPCYRQADAVYALSLTPAQRDKLIGGVPATDGIAAFDYFIKHFNRGRPFILASHSQGSQVMEFILSRYMRAHRAVYRRMIAAYVIGYSVTPKYLSQNPFLKFARGASDTRRDRLLEHRGAHDRRQESRHPAPQPRHQPDHLDEDAGPGARQAEPGLARPQVKGRPAGAGQERPHEARA